MTEDTLDEMRLEVLETLEDEREELLELLLLAAVPVTVELVDADTLKPHLRASSKTSSSSSPSLELRLAVTHVAQEATVVAAFCALHTHCTRALSPSV